jgi:DNA-binding response OmpR family regulator
MFLGRTNPSPYRIVIQAYHADDAPDVVIYQFGHRILDTTQRELRRAGGLVAVEPQLFDVLTYLIEARDHVLSRDDLLEAVWNGRIVSDRRVGKLPCAWMLQVGNLASPDCSGLDTYPG